MADPTEASWFSENPYRLSLIALPAAAVLIGIGIWQLSEERTGNGVVLIAVAIVQLAVILWATSVVVRRDRQAGGA